MVFCFWQKWFTCANWFIIDIKTKINNIYNKTKNEIRSAEKNLKRNG